MVLLIGHDDVRTVLRGREAEIIDIVRRVHLLGEERGDSGVRSTYQRSSRDSARRAVCLPAFVGGEFGVSGVQNVTSARDARSGALRESVTITLNSMSSGQPEALVEGSLIVTRCLAASSALVAAALADGPQGLSLIGCGELNLEVLRFLRSVPGLVSEVTVTDRDSATVARFAESCAAMVPSLPLTCVVDAETALAANRLVSFATDATEPYIGLGAAKTGTLVLHLSLRDLYPDTILSSYNIVDSADHVCHERTSLHLAELLTYGRAFISCTASDLLRGKEIKPAGRPTVFSAAGPGSTAVAVADFVRTEALRLKLGVQVDDFLPHPATQPPSWPTASRLNQHWRH
jgi:N-[(2S)-2-amino-2-carboxyethyl]-L-glutamate dehydrogenase